MAEINDLNTTDASNTARFPEGQAPSTVNDGARALEGMLARGFKDAVESNLDSAGSSNAYTVAANRTLSAYYDGMRIGFHASFANTGAATLNVDSVGAKTLKKHHDQDLESGDIEQHQYVDAVYSASDDVFQVISPLANIGLVAADIGVTVQAFDADTLKADTSDNLAVGYSSDTPDQGTKSTGTFTPAFATSNFQHYVNGGAHTLAPPSSGNGSMSIQITNNASAGAITTSGFTIVTGDTLTTTDGDDFMCYVTVNNAFSHLHVTALQ